MIKAEELCDEILGLSKMNWNSSTFSIDLPITLFFSKRVGNILSEAESVTAPKTRYQYYM